MILIAGDSEKNTVRFEGILNYLCSPRVIVTDVPKMFANGLVKEDKLL